MATIEIHRPWAYFGCVRKLKVWIDGVHVGHVRTRTSEAFEVTNAPHAIRVSMDWCKSVPFKIDLSNGGTAELIAQTIWFPASAFLMIFWPPLVFSVVPKWNI